jgi:ABC-type thiamin/hydroxymethylpyrimidine transport system permease subunit
LSQKLRCILLDHDLGLEIQAGGKTEIFMRRPGVAINTTMLAAAVRIDAGIEADVGTIVKSDERF